jgi:hypothetical protein
VAVNTPTKVSRKYQKCQLSHKRKKIYEQLLKIDFKGRNLEYIDFKENHPIIGEEKVVAIVVVIVSNIGISKN